MPPLSELPSDLKRKNFTKAPIRLGLRPLLYSFFVIPEAVPTLSGIQEISKTPYISNGTGSRVKHGLTRILVLQRSRFCY